MCTCLYMFPYAYFYEGATGVPTKKEADDDDKEEEDNAKNPLLTLASLASN